MVRHIVTFKFTGTPAERREVAEAFKKALLALPEQIEELKSMEVGINENPAETWDLTLIAEAETFADVATYSAHPAHQAAISLIAGHKGDRACVDFKI